MHCLRILLKNKGIWLSWIVLLICYCSASIDLWNSSVCMDVSDQPSAFIYSLEAILFGGVINLFPFCACLPIACFRTKNNIEEPSLSAVFVLGGLAVVTPFLLHTIIWNILAIPVNPTLYESHELQMYGLLNDLYDVFFGIPVYCIFSFGMFLCGGTMAMIYLVAIEWIEDRIAAFSFPALLYFGWLQLSIHCSSLQIPAPMDLFDEGMTIHGSLILLLIYFCLIYLCGKLHTVFVRKGE